MNRLPIEYFEKTYANDSDPWGFSSRWYEARKYALTLAALPHFRYERAFEPGCSIGVLTEKLAQRCDGVVSSELVPEVAERARERVKHLANVEVRSMAIPDVWPEGEFDLIVLSEIVYYLTSEGVSALLKCMDRSLRPGGHVVAVHWTGKTDYPLTGEAVHARLDLHRSWRHLSHYREREFMLSVYERRLG